MRAPTSDNQLEVLSSLVPVAIRLWSTFQVKRYEIKENNKPRPNKNKKLPKIICCCRVSLKLIGFIEGLVFVFLAVVFFFAIEARKVVF